MAETDRRLRELMEKHGLTYKQVSELLDVSLPTVTSWLRLDTAKAKRFMPGNLLELLEYKLGERP